MRDTASFPVTPSRQPAAGASTIAPSLVEPIARRAGWRRRVLLGAAVLAGWCALLAVWTGAARAAEAAWAPSEVVAGCGQGETDTPPADPGRPAVATAQGIRAGAPCPVVPLEAAESSGMEAATPPAEPEPPGAAAQRGTEHTPDGPTDATPVPAGAAPQAPTGGSASPAAVPPEPSIQEPAAGITGDSTAVDVPTGVPPDAPADVVPDDPSDEPADVATDDTTDVGSGDPAAIPTEDASSSSADDLADPRTDNEPGDVATDDSASVPARSSTSDAGISPTEVTTNVETERAPDVDTEGAAGCVAMPATDGPTDALGTAVLVTASLATVDGICTSSAEDPPLTSPADVECASSARDVASSGCDQTSRPTASAGSQTAEPVRTAAAVVPLAEIDTSQATDRRLSPPAQHAPPAAPWPAPPAAGAPAGPSDVPLEPVWPSQPPLPPLRPLSPMPSAPPVPTSSAAVGACGATTFGGNAQQDYGLPLATIDAALTAGCGQVAGRSASCPAEHVIGGPDDPGTHPA